MTSAGVAAARSAAAGHRSSHSRQTGSTRATGVCWSITSLTNTAQASMPGRRHGRSRAAVAYQSTMAVPVDAPAMDAPPVGAPRVDAPLTEPPVVWVTESQCAARGGGRGAAAPPGRAGSTTVPGVLHPVGKLPAAVYWRRRLVLLVVVLAVLGGGGWFGYLLVTRHLAHASAASAGTTAASPTGTPALEQVVPSIVALRTPSPPPPTTAKRSAPAAPAPTPGGPCTDAMISVAVRAPATAAVGSKPTFELVVTNTSPVPCVRTLDKGQQELALADAAGHRVWGSNDCFPEASSDTRTLAPHAAVAFPVVWGGLTSEPTCAVARVRPPPGAYALHGRLATKVSAAVPLRLV